MILFTRSVGIAHGMQAGAIAQAKTVADFINKNYGMELYVGLPIGGNPLRITWAGRYENLAAMEDMFDKLAGDADYGALIAKGLDNYVSGTMEDRILKVI